MVGEGVGAGMAFQGGGGGGGAGMVGSRRNWVPGSFCESNLVGARF